VLGSVYGPGTGAIWLELVECSGGEDALEDCGRSDWGSAWCTHDDDVEITCSTNLTNTTGKGQYAILLATNMSATC